MPNKINITRYVLATKKDTGDLSWVYLAYPDDPEGSEIWESDLEKLKKDIPDVAESCGITPEDIIILKETTEEV
jgi:hypothetical protein